ncbi:MAG: Crp/Fnr family transcriptional regulator [Candidatus Thiodiazotropha sp. (ex Dulcina madagascariensis)]|nr:Crp/Fnr family transcriptional regulator [Candidatus Thiodiazotropha sp. (ex Dulcina madagascariensis)]MCU7925237.1 Crp/Fnr family transcriptional regulator [Candidatus Thiodiazotropha sp. (ex Dulcina madagascariensis)]
MNNFSLSDFDGLPLSDRDRLLFDQSNTRLTVKKKSKLLNQGDVCPEIYFLRSGLVKLCYHTLDGKEYIKSFIKEGGMFGSLNSVLNNAGSTFSAIALEDSIVDAVAYTRLLNLLNKYPQLHTASLNFFQQLALKKEMREYELLCLSAQQRYEKFCRQEAALMHRIKQADLASYLGITPVALSRMKNKSQISI